MPKTIRVTGHSTYNGKAWPKPGRIRFLCTQPASGFPSRPAFADFDTGGSFSATSYRPGDGLHPGKYVARFECWEVPPSIDGSTVEKSYILEGFQHEFEVRPFDRSVQLTIDVPPAAR